MEKRLFLIMSAAVVTLIAAVYFFNSKSDCISEFAKANAEAIAYDPLCENGCLDNGDGCLCHYWFPTYREAPSEVK